ncbi:hypothetical protein L226DRAFT_386728 [Lentinus tigrinus ALCF2SS1-7]|uniref:uncharacterized protein n=1 Tax=Lentinus tigrinus ALCF2SS1-7 TaxID=1328758 RepID=UPI0011662431|nr:hypothetical protein L226DRAFT_386728 [Lentinus tigrinus ALCF2SS1-7]
MQLVRQSVLAESTPGRNPYGCTPHIVHGGAHVAPHNSCAALPPFTPTTSLPGFTAKPEHPLAIADLRVAVAPSRWDIDIPLDVLLAIVKCVADEEARSEHPTQAHLYRAVVLSSVPQSQHFARTLQQCPELGKLAVSLQIRALGPSPRFYEYVLDEFPRPCPHTPSGGWRTWRSSRSEPSESLSAMQIGRRTRRLS